MISCIYKIHRAALQCNIKRSVQKNEAKNIGCIVRGIGVFDEKHTAAPYYHRAVSRFANRDRSFAPPFTESMTTINMALPLY